MTLRSDTPRQIVALRAIGFTMIALTFISTVTNDPQPGLSGDRLIITLALVLFLVCLFAGNPWRQSLGPTPLPTRFLFPRLAGFLAVALAMVAVQPHGFAVAPLYLSVVLAAVRTDGRPAAAWLIVSLAAWCLTAALALDHPGTQIGTALFGVPPWFLVVSMIRRLRLGQMRAEDLVQELQETRDAHAESAAQAERGRIAREMHDVLAHSLSGLALQLEGARLLAEDRDTDPEVVAALARAHHLAAGGLDEARRAISALHGDEVPGPDRLGDLAGAFGAQGATPCTLRVEGEPRPLATEPGLAVYRAAQEALTNVRKHAAADRVEMTLAYRERDVRLIVEDHGPGAPVTVGTRGASGYGLSGMRERAELLGGSVSAAPTATGFRVELCLPA